jgi:hypothetical protein
MWRIAQWRSRSPGALNFPSYSQFNFQNDEFVTVSTHCSEVFCGFEIVNG